jgi:hypothetical protein
MTVLYGKNAGFLNYKRGDNIETPGISRKNPN